MSSISKGGSTSSEETLHSVSSTLCIALGKRTVSALHLLESVGPFQAASALRTTVGLALA